MKNKGRKHKAARDSDFIGIANCKGFNVVLTRPVRSMSAKGKADGRFMKKQWVKRMRGYMKTTRFNNIIQPEDQD